MDDPVFVDRDVTVLTSALSDQASQEFIGRWHLLVSTTNWEKGRIISQWREALLAADAPVVEYSDEAWSQRVGGVTGQHVGRLRRVYERFGSAYEKFAGLYWSHFQAALDWPDAEMWLEGAAQSCWSVAAMRQMRFETLGRVGRVEAEEIVVEPIDEDAGTDAGDESIRNNGPQIDTSRESAGPRIETPDFGDEPEMGTRRDVHDAAVDACQAPLVRPFEHLPNLPDDLSDAFESFKLAILRHKTGSWRDVSTEAVLQSLDALKLLVLAPAD